MRRFISKSRERYDVIALEAPSPYDSHEAIFINTRSFLAACRSRLGDGGILALFLRSPAPTEFAAQILGHGAPLFKANRSVETGHGQWLFFSDRDFSSDPETLLARMPLEAIADAPYMEPWLRSLVWK